MKRTLAVFFFCGFIFGSFFISCSMLDITREFTYVINLTVNESGSEFYVEKLLSAADETSDIENYADKLVSIDIKKVEYTVTKFTGPDDQMINLAQLEIADTTGHGLQLLGKASDEYLNNLTFVTKELELEPAGVRRFEELYMYSPHAAKFFFSGNANTEPLDFQIKFYVIIEVTGNPI
ncbi:MAG: hypothetical protein R6W71_10065 [Bacteroidales bacterium]|jgi:hypothetical protein